MTRSDEIQRRVEIFREALDTAQQQLLRENAALTTQVGGNHYKDMAIQPVEYIHKNGIGYFEGCVIKYVSRWRKKNGVEDLKKARHFLDLLIEFEDAQRGGL